jgi:DNA repair photolyase
MAETLAVKINGHEVLDRQLAFRAKKEQFGLIALASGTDPYIKAEEQYRMSEAFLRAIHKHRFPVLIITKSALVLRDLEILRQIDTTAIHAPDLRDKLKRGVIISFSISTLNELLAATLEPGAPPPLTRLETMKKCKEAGFLVGVNCIPCLPFISDDDESLEQIVAHAKEFGADYILIGGLTLFGNGVADSKTLYFKFLERTHPHLVGAYEKMYGNFFMPPKSYVRALERRAERICNEYGIRRSIIEFP